MALRPLLDADVIQEIHQRDSVFDEETCELFEAIEDSFGIELGDYGPLCGLTITELAREVSKKANYPNREKCLSAVAFYRLRQALQKVSDIPRTAIRPSTPVAELLPWKNRRAQWQALEQNTGLTLPRLMIPTWLLYLCLGVPAAILIYSKLFAGFQLGWFGVFLAWIGLVIAALWAMSPFARNIPADGETLGGLTKVVLARNYAAFAKQYCGSTEDDVLSALQQLIATETGRSIEDIPTYTLIPEGLNIY